MPLLIQYQWQQCYCQLVGVLRHSLSWRINKRLTKGNGLCCEAQCHRKYFQRARQRETQLWKVPPQYTHHCAHTHTPRVFMQTKEYIATLTHAHRHSSAIRTLGSFFLLLFFPGRSVTFLDAVIFFSERNRALENNTSSVIWLAKLHSLHFSPATVAFVYKTFRSPWLRASRWPPTSQKKWNWG